MQKTLNKSTHPSLNLNIGIDLMGSDTTPFAILHSALNLSNTLSPSIKLHLFGTEEIFLSAPLTQNVHFVTAYEVITMEDDPLIAIRHKKKASMRLGIEQVKEKKLDAFISFGNTGALMASSKLSLSMLPGIVRPALLALMPNKGKDLAVLDVGANSSFKAEHLSQFALMGIAFQKSRGITHPKVGLLNIGAESRKGTPLLREVYQQLEGLNQRTCGTFVGNIEGRGALAKDIDVLVTDGFTGNVFLKTAEGIASVVFEQLQNTNLDECSPEVKAHLTALCHNLDIAEYPPSPPEACIEDKGEKPIVLIYCEPLS